MFEKVNPGHPDKVADRIAGAIVDLAYKENNNPKIAVEVLIGHGKCHIIVETDTEIKPYDIYDIVDRITEQHVVTTIMKVPQDENLAANQKKEIRCGDNGIFKGTRVTYEQHVLTDLSGELYNRWTCDGKYFVDYETSKRLVICQSNADTQQIKDYILSAWGYKYTGEIIVNPLGPWSGGIDVDSGATNRKLGSDMGDSITGGGLHGKDLSKADVSLNIFAYLVENEPETIFNEIGIDLRGHNGIKLSCAIGDINVLCNGILIPYNKIVEIARKYIRDIGGFEKFAEWGLIRPKN